MYLDVLGVWLSWFAQKKDPYLDLSKVIFYGFYHGRSPFHHNLGNIFYLFPTTLCKSKQNNQNNEQGHGGRKKVFRTNDGVFGCLAKLVCPKKK